FLWPVQKVEIEMIRAETGKACLARAPDAVSGHMRLPHLGHQEDTIALTCNRTADKFLRSVQFGRVDQGHPKGKARAQRFFFGGLRISSLPKTRGPLAEGRDNGAIAELDRPSLGCNGSPSSTLGPSIGPRGKHRAGKEERCCAKSDEVASIEQSVVHVSGLIR